MNLLPFLSILTVLTVAVPQKLYAWGEEGHEIVALIALHDLTPTAKAKILQMFRTERCDHRCPYDGAESQDGHTMAG